MRTALGFVCACTLVATVYLSLSLLILGPPNANHLRWSLMAALFVAQSTVTLVALAGRTSGGWARWSLLAGSIAIILVGASWARATLSGAHFEGYALVLGSMLVVQGALTLATVWKERDLRIA